MMGFNIIFIVFLKIRLRLDNEVYYIFNLLFNPSQFRGSVFYGFVYSFGVKVAGCRHPLTVPVSRPGTRDSEAPQAGTNKPLNAPLFSEHLFLKPIVL